MRALAARGESLASHRDGRGAPPARRDDREYREYLSEEQRSRRGCIARRMQPDFRHGLLAPSSGADWLAWSSIAIIGAIDSCDVAILTGQSAAQVLAKDTTA